MAHSFASTLPFEIIGGHGRASAGCPVSAAGLVGDKPFVETQYRDALSNLRQRPDERLAVYVHVPFCHVRCLYCACDTTVTHSLEKVDQYLDALEREMALVTRISGRDREIDQLYVGGGTPNHLNEPQLARLMEIVEHHFRLAPDARTAIECNPRRASAGQLELLYGLGFRRISFGVQDLNADVQRAIGRVQSLNMVRDVFQTARETGFESINLDLIYGLPFQTRQGFNSTLEQVLELNPDRVACFSYRHDPAARPHQHAINVDHLPKAPEKLALFQHAVSTLTAAGYRWVGLDVFVRDADELYAAQAGAGLYRNVIGYTPRPATDVLAFGPSGVGEVDGVLIQNETDLHTWQKHLNSGRLPVAWGRCLSETDRRRREAMLYLMCNLRLPASLAMDLGQEGYACLCRRAKDGLVEVSDEGIRITPEGRYLLRDLCAEQGVLAKWEMNQLCLGMPS